MREKFSSLSEFIREIKVGFTRYYTGCHKYVPFARFPNRRKYSAQRIEIITHMTTAMLLERLDQAILEDIDNLRRPNKLPLTERYSDKRSN